MDASNLLKPMLARGELHAIGATTLDEYRRYIEKDAALERLSWPKNAIRSGISRLAPIPCPGRIFSSIRQLGDMMVSHAAANGNRGANHPIRVER
jgi:ATP-dependent Clp protease ATP-binding subunit ClpB